MNKRNPLWRHRSLVIFGLLILLLVSADIVLLQQTRTLRKLKTKPSPEVKATKTQSKIALDKPTVNGVVLEGIPGLNLAEILLRDSRFTYSDDDVLLNKKEEFVGQGVVHPRSANILFFTTSDGFWDKQKREFVNNNRVYSYDIVRKELAMIYKDNYSSIRRIIGLDGSRLVLAERGFDDSPGACWSYWTGVYSDFLKYLDLAELDKGLRNYTVPKYKVDSEKKWLKTCKAQLRM